MFKCVYFHLLFSLPPFFLGGGVIPAVSVSTRRSCRGNDMAVTTSIILAVVLMRNSSTGSSGGVGGGGSNNNSSSGSRRRNTSLKSSTGSNRGRGITKYNDDNKGTMVVMEREVMVLLKIPE